MGDLNSTPATWAAGLVTSLMMNAEIRDPLTEIQKGWTDYTCTWSGSTTNPVIGNGTIDASYHRIGKTVFFNVVITMGSTTTYGSGQWRVSLPFTPAYDRWRCDADGIIGGNTYQFSGRSAGGRLPLNTPSTTAGGPDRSVTGTIPATWAAGDVLTVSGFYETT